MHIASRASAASEAADPRIAAMHSTTDAWLTALSEEIARGGPNTRFRDWLAAASRFPAETARNVILLTEQAPKATHVETARTWREEYDCELAADAEPIWLWRPTLAAECRACGELRAGHAETSCTADATWVATEAGHRPEPVFDVSQTTGEPARRDQAARRHRRADDVFRQLQAAGDTLGVDVRAVAPRGWPHGDVDVATTVDSETDRLTVAVKGKTDLVWMASAVIGELFALVVASAAPDPGTSVGLRVHHVTNPARALEAAAARGIVTQYFDLELTAPRLDLEAWRGNDPATLYGRLARISLTAGELIDLIDQQAASA
jgi:hypothetical protein